MSLITMMLFGMQCYEPWLLPNSQFRFRLPWNAYGLGAIPIEYGRVLWLNVGELTTELNEKKGI